MSYTRIVEGNVHYEGRVSYSGSVSYPASQNGGTKSYSGSQHYSGTVPIKISVHVDTKPFDSSIAYCNGNLGALGSSVVAMNAAQCAEIEKSSDRVAKSIVGGFFNLIKSEISQAMAGLMSKINSSIMLIKTHATRINEQKDTMQKDYSRLSSHYIRLFSELDKECQRRIVALDKRAFAIAINVMRKQYIKPHLEHIGTNFTHFIEEPFAENKIESAKLKQKARDIISNLEQQILQNSVYSNKLSSILRDEKKEESEIFFLPVLYAEYINIESGRLESSNYTTKDTCPSAFEKIDGAVGQYFKAKKIDWRLDIDPKEEETIGLKFNSLLQEIEDERIIEKIKELKSLNKPMGN